MPVKLVKDSTKGLVDKERYSESTVQFHKPELVPIFVVSKTTVLFVFERRKYLRISFRKQESVCMYLIILQLTCL